MGFSTDLGPTICGGWLESGATNKCFTLTNGNTWTNSFNLTTPRYQASYIPISASKALVIGGRDGNGKKLNTMEIVSTVFTGSAVVENTLPFTYHYGCATKLNHTHGLLIGGHQGGYKRSSKTYFINLNTLEYSLGPEMKRERSTFACATMKNEKVFVGGGYGLYATRLASTEILDLTKPNPSWTSG